MQELNAGPKDPDRKMEDQHPEADYGMYGNVSQ